MAVIKFRCFSSIRSTVQGVNINWILLSLFLLLFVSRIRATPRECDVNLQVKGLSKTDLPDLATHGPLCGADSCCGTIGEKRLVIETRTKTEKFLKDSIYKIVSLFDTRAKQFDELFRVMMHHSKQEFHNMFEKTYGVIYLRNSEVFTDFFAELEKYYGNGSIRLTETMDTFFAILYQKMFTVINGQYTFDEDYLTCVAKDIAKLKPFGDIPSKLGPLLRRSFVATRIFYKSLSYGAQVAEKMLRVNISHECGQQIARMQYCGVCTRQKGAGTCNSYCIDVMGDCMRQVTELGKEWDNYIDAIDKVAHKLLGPFNIEMVVEPINIKISEAIMNFQESGNEVSQKVFVECGAPQLEGVKRRRRRRSASAAAAKDREIKFEPLEFNKGKKKPKKNNNFNESQMERLIHDIKQKVKETRQFWTHLPYQYCNNEGTAGPTQDGSCWNGTKVGSYVPKIPATDSDQTYTTLQEQIYTLQVLTNKLQAAHQGMDVELLDQDEEESVSYSGSGSGDGTTEIDDIDIVDDTTTTTTETPVVTILEGSQSNEGNEKVAAASGIKLTKALLHYVLPIVMVWFGGAVTELL